MFQLIAYKPDSSDYCRGCLMESFSSGFKFFASEKANDVLFELAKLKKENKLKNRAEAEWECILLVDGDLVYDPYAHANQFYASDEIIDKYTKEIIEEAEELSISWILQEEERKKIKEREEKERLEIISKNNKEKLERKEYERLKLKYEHF